MSGKTMTDLEIEKAMDNHKPLTVGDLTFTGLGECGGMIRIDLPRNREKEAVVLDELDAERLCCWLTFRFPAVRKYLDKLKPVRGKWVDGQTLGQAIGARVKELTGSKPGKHSGDAKWLADQTGVWPMSALRYLNDSAIPQPEIAYRIAKVLVWSEAEMKKRIADQKIRRQKAKG